MSIKYHISPRTGLPNICRAKSEGSCPLGGDAPHFEEKEEARAYMEDRLSKVYAAGPLRKTEQPTEAPQKSETKAAELPTVLSHDELAELNNIQVIMTTSYDDPDIYTVAKHFSRKHKVALAMSDFEGLKDNLRNFNSQIDHTMNRYPYRNREALFHYEKLKPRINKMVEKLDTIVANREVINQQHLAVAHDKFDSPIKLPDLKKLATNVLSIFKRKKASQYA